MPSHLHRRLAVVLGATLLGACGADQESAFEPPTTAPARILATSVPGASCQVIDFEGFAHGDEIESVALSGYAVQFAVQSFKIEADWEGGGPTGGDNPNNFLRAFDSNVPNGGTRLSPWEDIDLIDTPGGTCAACGDNGLGKFLVIEDERGFDPWGDYRWGGRITLTGLPAGAWIESFHAVDDDSGEPPIKLFVDGAATPAAFSTGLGDASVELVSVPKTPISQKAVFQFGTEAMDQITGSGAVDNIVVCTEDAPPPPPSNPGTGTIGYWKNHASAWPVDQIVIGGRTYSKSAAISIMKTSGKGDKTYDMFNQLVAAKLNVLIGNDAECIDETIADADAWMTANPLGSKVKGGSSAWRTGEPLHGRLDQYNNGRLCAPHRG
jgi:hypothetical protein